MSQHPSYTHTVCGVTVVVFERKAFLCGAPATEGQLIKLKSSLERAIETLRVPLHPEDCIHLWREEEEELFNEGSTVVKCSECGVKAEAEQAAEYRKERARRLESGTNG